MSELRDVQLRLTTHEGEALAALTAGVGRLADRDIEQEAAVVAAVELGLTRLIEDFELPSQELQARVASAREKLRRHWIRGNACV